MKTKAIIKKIIHWHAIETDVVFNHAESQPGGLTQKKTKKRLAEHGANRLRPPKKRSQLNFFSIPLRMFLFIR